MIVTVKIRDIEIRVSGSNASEEALKLIDAVMSRYINSPPVKEEAKPIVKAAPIQKPIEKPKVAPAIKAAPKKDTCNYDHEDENEENDGDDFDDEEPAPRKIEEPIEAPAINTKPQPDITDFDFGENAKPKTNGAKRKPTVDELSTFSSIGHLIKHIVACGINREDDIYDICKEYREQIPILNRTPSMSFEETVRTRAMAIMAVIPAGTK
jgi:hypothetical protein